MTRFYTFLCAALLALALSSAASAQQTEPDCGKCTDCANAEDTLYVCRQQVSTGTDTECGPCVLPERTGCLWVVNINKVQAACPFPAMTVEDSDQVTTGAPTVWHEVGVLTGPTSPSVSKRVPLHRIGPAVRTTFADITDANCTDVRVVARCE